MNHPLELFSCRDLHLGLISLSGLRTNHERATYTKQEEELSQVPTPGVEKT